jgi:hypothetical protein
MHYAVEIGLEAVIYIPSFIKIESGIRRQIGDNINLLLFIKNRESGLQMRTFKYIIKGSWFYIIRKSYVSS